MKPFRVSVDYLEWAHGAAVEDGHPLALVIAAIPARGSYKLITAPVLVAEIADVAELYVGGDDNNLQACRVFARATRWLAERGLTVKQALKSDHSWNRS